MAKSYRRARQQALSSRELPVAVGRWPGEASSSKLLAHRFMLRATSICIIHRHRQLCGDGQTGGWEERWGRKWVKGGKMGTSAIV